MHRLLFLLPKFSFSDGFGFEDGIIWSKPCLINKIVEDSPAHRSHLEVGDFIIFIDKVNVVDMGQSEILERMNKSEAITLEVFRRAKATMQVVHTTVEAPTTLAVVSFKNQNSTNDENSIESFPIIEPKKNKLISRVSNDSKKKQLVTFSKNEVRKFSCEEES